MADTPDPKQTLTANEVLDAGLADWRQIQQTLVTRFRTGDFATALELTNRIGAIAEAADHHPDVDLRYGRVDVTTSSHDVDGITSRDLRLAADISGSASELGVEADPGARARLEVALDTPDLRGVKPFWLALLGGDGDGQDEVAEPTGQLPVLWFQSTDAHETPRQRFHLDVLVPHDMAQARVDAALAAGGTLVDDGRAPSFWVLADGDGNKACVCTQLGRD